MDSSLAKCTDCNEVFAEDPMNECTECLDKYCPGFWQNKGYWGLEILDEEDYWFCGYDCLHRHYEGMTVLDLYDYDE